MIEDRGRTLVPARRQRRSRAKSRRLLLFAAACLIPCLWLGCSVQKHYDILSFFFDGVPDPAMLASGKLSLAQVKEAGGTIYTHPPFAEEKCAECHRGRAGSMLTTVESAVCLKCHGGIPEQHPMMHGPVAASACLWCHAPHESIHKQLLRDRAPNLCRQCHGPGQMGNPTSPAHTDLQRDCLECHTGHGGTARYFLRSLIKEDAASPQREPALNGAP